MDMFPVPESPRQLLEQFGPDTPKGRALLRVTGDVMLKAEKTREALVGGMRDLYSEAQDSDDELAKAEAAKNFISATVRAEEAYRAAVQDAAFEMVEAMTEGQITAKQAREQVEQLAESTGRASRAQSALRTAENLTIVEEYIGRVGDGSPDPMVEISTRKDFITEVRVDGADEALYFAENGEYLGTEEPQLDVIDVPLGESNIDGIDLSTTFDPDAAGRQIRDFDGGLGD